MFRLTSISVPSVGLALSYQYLANGDLWKLTEGAPPVTTTFTYDDLDRLAGANGEYGAACAYSPIGNLESKVEGATSLTYDYTLGRPTSTRRSASPWRAIPRWPMPTMPTGT